MNNEVKALERPVALTEPSPIQLETAVAHIANPSQPGGLSKTHMLLLIGLAALLHAAAWCFFQQTKSSPVLTFPEIPEITVELSSPEPPTPPQEEPTPPTPPPPEPAPPQEDEDALKEPPKPLEKPKSVVKPKPVSKPQPTKPVAAPAAPPAPVAPTAAPAPVKETAAISGLASLGNPPPEYPGLALRRSWEGSVGLRIQVLPNGRAGSVEVIKSSGRQVLDDAAVETVRKWKFIPAKRGDAPIEGFANQTINFKLPE